MHGALRGAAANTGNYLNEAVEVKFHLRIGLCGGCGKDEVGVMKNSRAGRVDLGVTLRVMVVGTLTEDAWQGAGECRGDCDFFPMLQVSVVGVGGVQMEGQ